jgi:hypothetical protein
MTALTSRRLKGVARGVVTAAVLLSPWLFASASPWAFLLISLLVSLGAAVWLLSLFGEEQAHVRAPALTLALVALLLFVLMQMLPLPGSFVRLVNPLSYEAQTKRAQVFEEIQAKDFLPSEISYDAASATISASPSSTWQSLCLLAAYIGVFLVMVNTFREWWELRQAAAAIVISSFIMAVFALLQKFSGTTNIYWFHTPRFGGQIFGPFTNRDHFACYMNMALASLWGCSSRQAGCRNFKRSELGGRSWSGSPAEKPAESRCWDSQRRSWERRSVLRSPAEVSPVWLLRWELWGLLFRSAALRPIVAASWRPSRS